MSVIRIDKKKNYTVMSNTHLQDPKLSLKAKGLLAMCLSFPDNWNYNIIGLTYKTKDGKGCVMSTLKELENAGYLKRRKIRDEKGRIVDTEYIIMEEPVDPCPHNPDAENPDTVNPDIGAPYLDNPTLMNTNTQITDTANTDTQITNPIRSDRRERNACKAPAGWKMPVDWRVIKEEVEGQIGYCNLINNYPRRKGEIDELVMITSEALCSGKPTLRVNGEERPASMVKDRLKMLRYDHIRYVLDCLSKTSSKMPKPDLYLLTSLYNAPATINTFYNTEANHDMYGYPD